MSTKNDKTIEDLVLISKQMLSKMTLEEIERWYFEHSSRELDAWCNSEYGISAYYGEKIIHDILGIRKKNRSESYSYWKEHMIKTHVEKYGGVGFASEELASKSYSTNECQNGYKYYNNRVKSKETRKQRYGDENYNNSKKSVETCTQKWGGVGYASPELKQKSYATCLKLYGKIHCSDSKKQVATSRKHWGYKNYNNREKSKQTCLTRYGVSSYSKTTEFNIKRKARYVYDGIYFDSSWEMCFWIYMRDKNHVIEHNTISFTYMVNNKEYTYIPDFVVDHNKLYEIKGDHFFENGKMINPFDRSLDDHYEIKHQCGLKNNVTFLTGADVEPYIEYVKHTYGDNFIENQRIK